jgi:hypothetical protein
MIHPGNLQVARQLHFRRRSPCSDSGPLPAGERQHPIRAVRDPAARCRRKTPATGHAARMTIARSRSDRAGAHRPGSKDTSGAPTSRSLNRRPIPAHTRPSVLNRAAATSRVGRVPPVHRFQHRPAIKAAMGQTPAPERCPPRSPAPILHALRQAAGLEHLQPDCAGRECPILLFYRMINAFFRYA